MSGRGLCDGLVTHPEESYRLWCVSTVCDHETSTKNEEAQAHVYKAVEPYKKKLSDPAQISIPELAPVMMMVLPFMLVELRQTPRVK
jgi:hypothetical protein